ncbi:MAG: RsmE family RNA methyltransferase [Patescibacteria group bacterium]|nr:RsmE family RNA methyltransferase [Patescibacteria group bacterium]
MKRKIFINQNLKDKEILKIEDPEIIDRINNVYRLKINEELFFVGSDLFEAKYLLKEKNKNKLIFQFREKIKRNLLPLKNINLYLSFIRKENFELILSKTFELGIKKIIPVKSERCSWTIDKISERWEKIILKGLEIADWNYLPKIERPLDFFDLPPKTYILDRNGQNITEINFPKNVSFFIGPEGGLSEKEYQFLRDNNYQLVSLTKSNLRAETAFFIFASILNFS